jgi:fructose-1,6-bisphosphatase/inositol monophosphatase family enzyme
VAAGLLMVEEANGKTAGLSGAPVYLDHPELIAAASPELLNSLVNTVTGANS